MRHTAQDVGCSSAPHTPSPSLYGQPQGNLNGLQQPTPMPSPPQAGVCEPWDAHIIAPTLVTTKGLCGCRLQAKRPRWWVFTYPCCAGLLSQALLSRCNTHGRRCPSYPTLQLRKLSLPTKKYAGDLNDSQCWAGLEPGRPLTS